MHRHSGVSVHPVAIGSRVWDRRANASSSVAWAGCYFGHNYIQVAGKRYFPQYNMGFDTNSGTCLSQPMTCHPQIDNPQPYFPGFGGILGGKMG